MNKNEFEKIIKDTIEYANEEIKRRRKKYLKRIFAIFGVVTFLLIIFFIVFKYEIPIKYNDKLIDVKIPEDTGLDIYVNLENYKRAKAVLVKTDENIYDLYINVTYTFSNKMFKDNDKSDNFLRVGNGIILDFQSGELSGYMPNGYKSDVIKNIYYIDNLSNKVSTMADSKLINSKDKVLIWSR